MNKYETLKDQADQNGILVLEESFTSLRLKGMYCDGVISINKNLRSTAEAACILAEEIGHHETSYGDILDMRDVTSRKQEHIARMYGHELLIGLRGIIACFKAGCQNRYEMAEYLEVTEEFLQECLDCYKSKYGVYTTYDNFVITFIPNLTVTEIL